MYKIVSWDSSVLDGLRHMEPAGPLYSIECHKGSIRRLHLPHCETRTDVVKLTVAHVTGGNVEMLQPLKVTKKHVILEVQRLSPFGLLKALLLPAFPIRAQVLLFFEKSLSKLHIHLLPGNVPVKEDEMFECDYGPNYHPTFEVFLNTEVIKVTLSLLDENSLVVWKPRDIMLTAQAVGIGEELKIFELSGDDVGKKRMIWVTELLEMIEEMVAENKVCPLKTDIRSSQDLEDMWRRANKNLRGGGGFPPRSTDWPMYALFKGDLHKCFKISITEYINTRFEVSGRSSIVGFVGKHQTLYLHAGQFKCKFSDLVFDMKGEGRVMYKIVSWDRRVLDGLRHMEPAGPLYSIECHNGSIRRLHFPHCETRTDVVKLTVAHVTGGNVEMLQPLKITNTHVIIEVQNLSPFGLLKALLWPAFPIRAQVLLFFEKSLRKFHIHLLPGNVPVEEVQKRHKSIRYITTSSKCELTPGKKYRPCCKTTDREYVSQPEDEKFECDYGPNYHPTFEVFLNTGVTKVTLSLLDETGLVVWTPRDINLTGTQRAATSKDSPGADFVDKYKADLIQRVLSVMEIVDCIKNVQKTEEYSVMACSEASPVIPHLTLYLHAGQFKCKFSDLVFDMKGKDRVMYKIVSWDSSVLDGLRHMEPAGPLYSIECHNGSIRRLHLPHCETRTDVVKLTVAHVTGGNVEMLQPLKVTNKHVIIEVQRLSLFGLLKALLLPAFPIRAQVLLFFEKSLNKLHIHLLPGNVPVKEVQKRYKSIRYITTSSKCILTPGKKYRPCCKPADREYISQPEDETFECDYGPNYHPTFEVFLNNEVNEVTLSLLDEKGLVVWKPRDVVLKGTQRSTTSKDLPGADFVDKYEADLIQRVPSVMEILDCIKSKEFTSEMYNKIHAETTPQDKMRELYKYLNSAGRAAKAEFYRILREKHHNLVTELESVSGLD
ncbi:hypothetical protein KOW79_021735 [Hemibagrus wyckioides]|uniref:Uncharacterized protein n=1 Tax=Hemibagrus wyckioides TaxID=337641 RepID=A0A9D3N4U5_9TELE|nr:hypothetical protein KOW79_021735 [Hemibagrus wyckioides]